MQCFKCHKNVSKTKSEHGFYYFCSNCGRTFETEGQKRYNSKKYNSRFDYEKKEIIDFGGANSNQNNDQNTKK